MREFRCFFSGVWSRPTVLTVFSLPRRACRSVTTISELMQGPANKDWREGEDDTCYGWGCAISLPPLHLARSVNCQFCTILPPGRAIT
jgi:hypothetical protein